ncbi:MAG: sigma-70 family RNA polymerase sigma factor [Victivallales bacterium]|nr:sigma-70 family RNA polymerase sigma factor [Victivallales bacterium]
MREEAPAAERDRIFEELIDTRLPTIRRVIFRIVGNAADTDDVIQQAMLKAWCRFDTCNSPQKISAWVCRIACNEAYDLLRRRQRETAWRDSGPATETGRPGHGENAEITEAVALAMKRLPQPLHAALSLTVFEKFSAREAAAALGCSPATLYWRVFKARKLLAKQLRELLP